MKRNFNREKTVETKRKMLSFPTCYDFYSHTTRDESRSPADLKWTLWGNNLRVEAVNYSRKETDIRCFRGSYLPLITSY